MCLEFCAPVRGGGCSPQRWACSKAWGLTHNPNSLSETTLNHLAQVLLVAFWGCFSTHLPQGVIWSSLRWICPVRRGEGDMWMPYTRKGDKDQEGKGRKESTGASSHLNPTKKCDPEPLSAQDTCWTTHLPPLTGWELKDVFFSGAMKTCHKIFCFCIPSNFTSTKKKKITPSSWKTTATITRKGKNPTNTQTSCDSHIPARMFQI